MTLPKPAQGQSPACSALPRDYFELSDAADRAVPQVELERIPVT